MITTQRHQAIFASILLVLIAMVFVAPACSSCLQMETCTELKVEQDKEDLLEKEFIPNQTEVVNKERARFLAMNLHIKWTFNEALPIPTPPPECV